MTDPVPFYRVDAFATRGSGEQWTPSLMSILEHEWRAVTG